MNFNVGLSGIQAAQGGLKVTQQNIANMSTQGYVRQKVVLEEVGIGAGQGNMSKVGSGVQVKDIAMVMDSVLQGNYNAQNSKTNYYSELEGVLYETETVLGDYTDGSINNLLQSFSQAWEEISKFPEESSYRYALLGETSKLTSKINEMGEQLSRLENDAKVTTEGYLKRVNEISDMIASINGQINKSGEYVPNELINERIKLIEELSGYVETEVAFDQENPNIATVRVGGAFLVSGQDSYKLKLYSDNGTTFVANGTTRVDFNFGKLGASINVNNEYLSKYRNTLETFTNDFKDAVNDIHRQGYSVNGQTDFDFFVGDGTKTIAINPQILADSSKLATSALPDVEGNVDIARKLGQLISTDYKDSMSYLGYLSSFSMEMSQDLNTVTNQATIQYQVLSGMEGQKESLQGVNLEEEMSNMFLYQQMYQANAKTLNMVQKTMDALMEII